MSNKGQASSSKSTGGRDAFVTSLGALVVTLGSAVGLGNIWKFPALAGQNGGAAFVLLYLLCVAGVGLPVLIAELLLGRRARANAVSAFRKLAPGKAWYLIGISGVIAAVMIMAFYTDVAGWVYSYAFKALTGGLSADQSGAVFDQTIGSPVSSLMWQWLALAVTTGVVVMGVGKGIERVIKRLMPLLLVLLIICDIRALSLPGASEGLDFLFRPDFSKLSAAAVLTALGLAFFKLSLGMGTMLTYGSYMNDSQSIPGTAAKVALADTMVSLLAGIAIFPAVFAFGFEPTAGPGLLFVTIPSVFAAMPFGGFFTFLFFVLTAVAATGAMISLVEVPVAFVHETLGWSRRKAGLLTAGVMALLGVPATLSTNLWSSVKVFDLTFFDLFDFISSNILLPVGGITIALFVGWVWSKGLFVKLASNQDALRNQSLMSAVHGLLRFVTPVAVTIVLLNGLGLIKI
ncbi:MAG: sodium-dependent transporter [Bacillota bacterium]|jgi:NSS family neurotransmitter:Na+ symporter